MKPSPHYRPMTPARRASILLLILGGLAVLGGVALMAGAPKLAESPPPPELQQQIVELNKQNVPIDFRMVLIASGALLLVYGVAAVTMGALVRGAGRATAIVTLILAAIVTAIMAINAGASLLQGLGAEAILGGGMALAHGMVVKWMIQTLQRTTPVAAVLPPTARKPPLADYYIPPSPPGPLAS